MDRNKIIESLKSEFPGCDAEKEVSEYEAMLGCSITKHESMIDCYVASVKKLIAVKNQGRYTGNGRFDSRMYGAPAVDMTRDTNSEGEPA